MRHNSKRKFNSLSHFWKEGSILWFCQNLREKDQSLRHIQEKRFILRVIFRKKGSILWVMKKRKVQFLWLMLERRVQFRESHEKMVQFCESCFFFKKVQLFESFVKRSFNSLSFVSHVQKKKSFLWLMLEKWVWFVDSYWKRGFSALSHTFKSSILWFIFSKGSILESHIFEEGQVFESYWKKKKKTGFNSLSQSSIPWDMFKKEGSILWVILKKKKKQFFESLWEKCSILWVTFKKKGSILRVKLKKGSILWVIFSKNDQFILWIIHCVKKKYSLSQTKKETFSLSHVEKKCSIFDPIIEWYFWEKIQFFETNRKKGPIHQVIRRFCCSNNLLGSNSLSPFVQSVQSIEWNSRTGSILWDIFKQRFDSLSRIQQNLCHSEKKNSFLWINKKVQFCESHSRKNSDFRVIFKKGSILWVKKSWKFFNSLSHIQKRVQFFDSCEKKFNFYESCLFQKKKKSSILWVIKIKFV